MKDVRVRLGGALKECRTRQRLTQEQLAERSGLSYKFIGEIERGRGNPTVDTLARLAQALNVSLSALFLASDDYRRPDEYQISKHDLQLVREALESISDVTNFVSNPSYRRTRQRRRT